MSKAKSAHYSKIIAEHSGDYGSLWKAFNKILHRWPKIHLPDHSSIATLANTFSSFFINKISVIRSSFPSDSHSRVLKPPDTRKVLQNLSCVSADEVRHLVLRAPCKSSDLDPIPTSLVKDCIGILITQITSIINLSLTEGSFPSHFKWYYSIVAFDTMDRTILLSRLDDWFGVTGKALNWFKPYLTGRCQRIKIGDCLSSKADLKFGVPQGSLLGPLLFTLYTTPLSSIVEDWFNTYLGWLQYAFWYTYGSVGVETPVPVRSPKLSNVEPG